MDKAFKRLGLALALSAGLVLAWKAGSHIIQKRKAERQALSDYASGPLSGATLALSRGLPVLSEGSRKELPLAADAANQAVKQMEAILLALPQGPLRKALQELQPLHVQLAALVHEWQAESKPSPARLKEWKSRETGLRDEISRQVMELRDLMMKRQRLPLSLVLEINALITSLGDMESMN